MTEIGDLLAFVKVVEQEGFTAAAAALNCTTSSISKKINRLEHKVGAKLINRSTHGLHLTEAGTGYFERTRKILIDLDDAHESVRAVTSKLSGTLKVHMIPGAGQRLVLPWILEFMRRYPSLAIHVSDRTDTANILRAGFDVSIKSAVGTDIECPPGIEARELSRAGFHIYGSRSYFERYGRPSDPYALVNHNCFIASRQRSANRWWFTDGKKKFAVNVQGNLVTDDWAVIYDAIRAGLGIGRLLDLNASRRFVPSGDLEAIFTDCAIADRVLWALVPSIRPLPKKIQMFIDFLAKALRTY